jgi:hypothetical protein
VSGAKVVAAWASVPVAVTAMMSTSAPRATERQIIVPSNPANIRFIILFLSLQLRPASAFWFPQTFLVPEFRPANAENVLKTANRSGAIQQLTSEL